MTDLLKQLWKDGIEICDRHIKRVVGALIAWVLLITISAVGLGSLELTAFFAFVWLITPLFIGYFFAVPSAAAVILTADDDVGGAVEDRVKGLAPLWSSGLMYAGGLMLGEWQGQYVAYILATLVCFMSASLSWYKGTWIDYPRKLGWTIFFVIALYVVRDPMPVLRVIWNKVVPTHKTAMEYWGKAEKRFLGEAKAEHRKKLREIDNETTGFADQATENIRNKWKEGVKEDLKAGRTPRPRPKEIELSEENETTADTTPITGYVGARFKFFTGGNTWSMNMDVLEDTDTATLYKLTDLGSRVSYFSISCSTGTGEWWRPGWGKRSRRKVRDVECVGDPSKSVFFQRTWEHQDETDDDMWFGGQVER